MKPEITESKLKSIRLKRDENKCWYKWDKNVEFSNRP